MFFLRAYNGLCYCFEQPQSIDERKLCLISLVLSVELRHEANIRQIIFSQKKLIILLIFIIIEMLSVRSTK